MTHIKMSYFRAFFLICLLPLWVSPFVCAQTIAQKKASLNRTGSDFDPQVQDFLAKVNFEITEKQEILRRLYSQVSFLYSQQSPDEEYRQLLQQINQVKYEIENIEKNWREVAKQTGQEESYGLWHQPDTTLEQLIIDYGSHDYVYLITPEIGSLRMSVDSSIPIPRTSWNEMLEIILAQNGVGIKQLTPHLRQVYFLKNDQSDLKLITKNRKELEIFPNNARVAFVLTPDPSEIRRIGFFLEKFVNPNTTTLQPLGRDLLIIAQVKEVKDLLKLYDFAVNNRGEKDFKFIPLMKIDANEMAKILGALFDQFPDDYAGAGAGQISNYPDSNSLKIIPLENVGQALFLMGSKEEIRKAEDVIREVECQFCGVKEKMVFWYTAKNSDAEELAEILSKIYSLMINERPFGADMPMPLGQEAPQTAVDVEIENPVVKEPPLPERLYDPASAFYGGGGYNVDHTPSEPRGIEKPPINKNRRNFIVDAKTGSIVMVIEPEYLPKIKDVLRKLDVPKKMVFIEVLLFEKRIRDQLDAGLNLLKIGCKASNKNCTGLLFNDHKHSKGLLEFIISKAAGHGMPAFDLIYDFLLTREDIQINSAPTITTMNQTPASIDIVEEISINTGVFEVETAKGVTLKDAYTRAQYGIWLTITPTIHMREDEDCPGEVDYITLDTDVMFDTTHASHSNRPDVTRRHITNQVRVADGETVILGGLRRKISHDDTHAIPFLGEIPGIGKLFSNTCTSDSATEMFIFITPRIIVDPCEDMYRIRAEEVCKRPGDIPEFLSCLVEARKWERQLLFDGGLTLLFGRRPERYIDTEPCCGGEYDGSSF